VADTLDIVAQDSDEPVYQPGQSIDLSSLQQAEPVAAAAVSGETVYYVQAGVFPTEDFAERAAVDIVLEVPNEAVTIKPLKNSDMYRVTIGPVLQADHAEKISGTLHAAGLDNFTVKVKE
jgi:cell division protein FtsN